MFCRIDTDSLCVLAFLLYKRAYFLWSGKHDERAIARHAGTYNYRLFIRRTVFARIGLEPQVELPKRKRFAGGERDKVRVATIADRRYLLLQDRIFQIEFWSAHRLTHHARGWVKRC